MEYLTLRNILIKEPRLIDFIVEVKLLKNLDTWQKRHRVWYKLLKPKMSKLVGFMAEKKELQTTEAYDEVYRFCTELAGM